MSAPDSKKYVEDGYVEDGYFDESGGSNLDIVVDSSSWTGLPSDFQLTERRRIALARAIEIAESDLEHFGASNAEKAQARAYIVAIRALSEAPDPPVEHIWGLVSKAADIATIAALFIPLIQAFRS